MSVKRDKKGRFAKTNPKLKRFKRLVRIEVKTQIELVKRWVVGVAIVGVSMFFVMLVGVNLLRGNIKGGFAIVDASGLVSYPQPLLTQSNNKLEKKEICDLSFVSNNDGYVQANNETLESIKNISNCHDKQILLRLSHYESTQNARCNDLGYCGLYQIGNAAWSDCHNIGIYTDAECAIYHYNINPNRFDSYTYNTNSFNF
jgi:hypothetical protein